MSLSLYVMAAGYLASIAFFCLWRFERQKLRRLKGQRDDLQNALSNKQKSDHLSHERIRDLDGDDRVHKRQPSVFDRSE